LTAKIIVGVDGSETSRLALIWASRVAAATDATVDPVMSWHPPPAIPTALGDPVGLDDASALEASARDELDSFVSGTREHCHPDARITEGLVARGAAVSVLCDLAEDADLLVVGSRGRGGFKGLVLGSVSAHCANASPSPVAIVPVEWDPGRSTGIVAVGIDGSENSEAAVRWADRWAGSEALVRLIHCWTYPSAYDAQTFDYDPSAMSKASEEMLDAAEAAVTGHRTESVSIHGDPRESLRAQSADADMLVIGARGHTGLKRLLLGSVASTVVHNLHVPTVVVHSPPSD
jgi:nucleotide-binding universal stress UspA family protein